MFVIDSSVVIASLRQEAGHDGLKDLIFGASCMMGLPNLLEVVMRVQALLPDSADAVIDSLLSAPNIQIMPFDRDMFEFARLGFQRFGKGRHPAGLNYGDCFAYGLAKARALPLLFKGQDFRLTDVQVHAASHG
jgi:ribonuclease VapC